MSLQPGTRLGSYEIVSELGSGGMGEVYKAKDLKLGRSVAIKLLHAEEALTADRLHRFEQEARAASALNHPNIVTIHEIGEHEGAPFIAMEFVEGKTLREVLHDGPLPHDKLIRYAIQLAEGLAKAHQAGIVHRDLKPDNVVLSEDGYVKILDFGLAKLMPEAVQVDSEMRTLDKVETREGVIVGTVHYMSPEQAAGRAVDFRSDQFALGSILYEMATGQRPFVRDTAAQTLAAIIADEVEPVTVVNPRVSATTARVIDRCLAKDPAERYASTWDIAKDIHWEELAMPAAPAHRRSLAAVGVVGLLAIVLVMIFGLLATDIRERVMGGAEVPKIESIAVLPLENLSGDPEQEYFSDGMTDELISQLAQIGSLRVISRTSVMQYKGARKPLPEIARELDVDAVVEGTVRRAEGRVRITAQLIEAGADRHLWAKSFERELQDVLALQSELAQAIAQEVRVTLTPQEAARLASARALDPRAHEAYLKGRYHYQRVTVADLQRSVAYLWEAIAVDPSYGEAYAALALTYSLLPNLFALTPEEGYPEAKRLAEKALSLNDNLEDAHLALGWTLVVYDHDWDEAVTVYRRAIALAPNSAYAHSVFGWVLSFMGRHEEALEQHRVALALDPVSAAVGQLFAASAIAARRYDDAIAQAQKTLALHPDDFFNHLRLGTAFALAGKYAEALAVLERADALTEDPVRPKHTIAWVYALMGNKEGARQKLREILATEEGLRAPFALTAVYAALGDRDLALESLERAYAVRDPNLPLVKVWPHLDPLRDDPRFQDLLRRMNFPE